MIESIYNTIQAPYAIQAISECRQRGARIAIATAESCPDFNTTQQQLFLSSIGIRPEDMRFCDTCGYYTNGDNQDTCNNIPGCESQINKYKNEPPYDNSDFKCVGIPTGKSKSIKEPMIKEILKNTKINKKNVILFDDQKVNRDIAKSIGIIAQSASENCDGVSCPDGTGLTCDEFNSGMKQLEGDPEVCIFDIDNTLTSGKNVSIKYMNMNILSILLILSIFGLFMNHYLR